MIGSLLLPTVKLKVYCETITPIEFSAFMGSTIRGAFGYNLRKVACLSGANECSGCKSKNQCMYAYVFETPIPENKQKISAEKAPHPFVIETEIKERIIYEPGESWTFNLILIGKGITFLPFFIYSFAQMGQSGLGKGRGKFLLKEVKDFYSGKIVSDGNLLIKVTEAQPLKISGQLHSADREEGHLVLHLLSPLRIVNKHTIIRKPEFEVIIRSILRRYTALEYFHDNRETLFDFATLIEKASKIAIVKDRIDWFDFSRFSTRQKRSVPLGGIVGKITYGKGWKGFEPLLKAAEILHIGKNCTFGLGQIKYEEINY